MQHNSRRHHGEQMEGLFERDGFYFRQRKGSLNIRKLESIDLDKLIREVDIDMLQQNMEDLTFSDFNEQHLQFFSDRHIVKMFKVSQLIIEYLLYTQNKLVEHLNDLSQKYSAKKRSLHQKRKEITILKEESRNLQDELKLKRRSLHSLNKAVKRATQETISSVLDQPPVPISSEPTNQQLCLFISFPDGSCVELLAFPQWTIGTIDEILRREFPTKIRTWGGQQHNYYHQGKLLPNDLVLRNSGVANKDSINVVIFNENEDEPIKPAIQEIPARDNDNSQIVGVVSQQMQVLQQLASDIRNILQHNASQKAATEVPTKVDQGSSAALEAIQARLMNIEHELQEFPNRTPTVLEKHIIFGELENDKDDSNLNGALNEIKQKLGESCSRVDNLGSKVDELRSLRDIVNQQRQEIEELKRSVQKQPDPVIIHVPPPEIKQQPTVMQPTNKSKGGIKVGPRVVDPATNKWNAMAAESEFTHKKIDLESLNIVPKKPTSAQPKIDPPVTIDPLPSMESTVEKENFKVKESVQPIPSPAKEEIVEVPLKPVEREQPTITQEEYVPQNSAVQRKISVVFPSKFNNCLDKIDVPTPFSVDLEPEMQDDEVIIALRKALSVKTKIPYSHTALKLDDYQIKLAVDLQGLIPHLSAEDASYLASVGRLQIFFNQPTITKTQIDMLESFRQADPSTRSSKKAKTKSSLDDLRLSLNNILESVNGTGLSDDDLLQKRNSLDKLISADDHYDLRKSRLNVVKNVGYVTSESESDFFNHEKAYSSSHRESDWEDLDDVPRHNRRSYNSLWQDYSQGSNNFFQRSSMTSEFKSALDQTLDSEGNNVPIHHRPSENSIMRYADSYEKELTRSEDSPFDGAKMDSLDHSLALSDSNNFVDTF